jgi:hypothetical protein
MDTFTLGHLDTVYLSFVNLVENTKFRALCILSLGMMIIIFSKHIDDFFTDSL